MWKRIIRWFWTPAQPQAYAVAVIRRRNADGVKYAWDKVVTYGKPQIHGVIYDVVGPFRSELDCEEFIHSQHQPTASLEE